MSAILTLTGVTKRFGGLAAVSGIDVHVDGGELLGLIGPNGAGKTTVFNLLTGVYAPTEGRIMFGDRSTAGLRPYQVTRLGIARTFQNIRLFPALSVLDNVKVAVHLRSRTSLWSAIMRTPSLLAEDRRLDETARALLDTMGLTEHASGRAKDLPYGLQRRVEIARALATGPKLLLLDEPAAGMNPQEKADLMNLIGAIRDQFHLTVLLIEHDMKVVMGICERIYVLDYGEIIAQGPPAAIQRDPIVIAAYLGEEAVAC